MRNGILATALAFVSSAGLAFTQGSPVNSNKAPAPKSGQVCPCQNQPRLLPGLFGLLGKRPAPQPSVEPPLLVQQQPRPAQPVAQAKQTPAPAKVLPAYLPPSIPPRTATLASPQAGVERVNYDHLLEHCGHDKNYTWITGVLTRKSGAPGWFIHYLPADAVRDLHGGVLPLRTNASFDGLREGDLVTIIGYIVTDGNLALQQGSAAFAAEQVNKIQQPPR
jgi:hypothetical protein